MMYFTISCMDCLEFLETAPDNSIDVIFLDPPYNTQNTTNKAAQYDRNKDFQQKNWSSFYAHWDTIDRYEQWSAEWLTHCKRILKDRGSMFLCGSFHNIPDLSYALRSVNMYVIQWIAWCIPNAFPNLSMTKMVNSNQTLIWVRKSKKTTHFYDKEASKRYNDGKNLRDFWIIPNDCTAGKIWKHPSKKPLALVDRALDIALPKEHNVRVLDFFAGSGTTGIASAVVADRYDLDIKCVLVDNEQVYIDMIQDRLYGR